VQQPLLLVFLSNALHKLYILSIFCATSVQRSKQEKSGSSDIDTLEAAWIVVPRAGIEPARPFSGSGGF